MASLLLILLQIQELQTPGPTRPEGILWNYRAGQEFYIEESQRQLLQVKGDTSVSSYFDYTYLWKYKVASANDKEVKIEATLDKVRVNNPNEAGGRAVERMIAHDGERSSWILTKEANGWAIKPAPGSPSKHATPLLLAIGTSKIDDTANGWKQQWTMPVTQWGTTELSIDITVKQQTTDRINVTTKSTLKWLPDPGTQATVKVMPQTNPIAGLGEFDTARGRWVFFEWRAGGTWEASHAGKTVTMKQDVYVFYRHYDRRPQFP